MYRKSEWKFMATNQKPLDLEYRFACWAIVFAGHWNARTITEWNDFHPKHSQSTSIYRKRVWVSGKYENYVQLLVFNSVWLNRIAVGPSKDHSYWLLYIGKCIGLIFRFGQRFYLKTFLLLVHTQFLRIGVKTFFVLSTANAMYIYCVR